VKVLVVSHASINEPHRAPYDRLARRSGAEVHIAAPNALRVGRDGVKHCDPPSSSAAYVLHPLRPILESSGRFTWYSGLAGLARRLRPDVVFLEQDPGSVAVLGVALAHPSGKRVAFSVENILRDRWLDARRAVSNGDAYAALRDSSIALLCWAGARASDAVAAISEEGSRVFREGLGWTKPLAVVPLGTDTERFRPSDARALRMELGLDGAFVVGYFGRLVPEKGVHLLVDALEKLPGRVRLLLDMFTNFQPGSYAAELMSRADRLGVRDRIITFDVPHDRVAEYMNVCDTVVLPSLTTPRWKEQFGRVLPEAMACGVPVVGARSGNIPDMIGDAGLLVDEGSSDDIARAVLELDADPALRHVLGERGRARVIERFSVEAQVDRMLDLFRQVGARP
jgi:glycosyltransferase involved in cell wall biosynthesis